MSLLNLQGVSKRFGTVTAVDDVSFAVERGEVIGFLGPNGAGKSTTMRMINQYLEPDDGEIQFDGQPLSTASMEAKRRIGYLPENNPLYLDMLVSEYLGFMADLRQIFGSDRHRAIDRTVATTALESVYYRPIGELSKGYRQRVGLAQAIMPQPDLLILDEPTEGLDPNQRLEIRHLIESLGQDRTVMLSTHVLSEVQHTCTRLLVINEGAIVADGAVDDLVARASGSVEVRVEANGTGVVAGLEALDGVQLVSETHDHGDGRVAVTVVADQAHDVRPAIFDLAKANGWTLYELHQRTRSLEHLFRELTVAEPS
jgi:ABC-2 type transport system ATP-binding protein